MSQLVLFQKKGGAGVITLNRPETLNALNFDMVRRIKEQLLLWKHDSSVSFVIIKSADANFFCSGGDLKEVYRLGAEKNFQPIKDFLRESYGLNQMIADYPKPYISLLQGLAMGGGLGISVHGNYRIVSEKSDLAMPEVFIGFFPDVGARYFFNKFPGKTGLFSALSGYRMKAEDAVYTGLATHYVREENIELLLKALTETDISGNAHQGIQAILELFSTAPQNPSYLQQNRNWIDEAFTEGSIEEIMTSLQISKKIEARQVKNEMEKTSPFSLKATYHLFTQSLGKNLKECLQEELHLAFRFLENSDIMEGIRSIVMDKDKNPKWQYKSVYDVPNDLVKAYFSGLA